MIKDQFGQVFLLVKTPILCLKHYSLSSLELFFAEQRPRLRYSR